MLDLLPLLRDLLAICASFAAVITDERTRRIPNTLTYGTALAALVLLAAHALLAGAPAWASLVLSSFAGSAFLLVLFGVLSMLGMLGFGDTKLLAAIGLCVGFALALRVTLCVLLAGGVVAVLRATLQGRLTAVFANLVRPARLRERPVTEAQPHLHLFGYAIAIALGTSWAVLGRYVPALLPI